MIVPREIHLLFKLAKFLTYVMNKNLPNHFDAGKLYFMYLEYKHKTLNFLMTLRLDH